MKVDQYPVYTATVNVNAPVKYHYVLGSEEEKFTRTVNSDSTLNEFFNRKVNVKKHPLLPKAYESFANTKKSKLFDGIYYYYYFFFFFLTLFFFYIFINF